MLFIHNAHLRRTDRNRDRLHVSIIKKCPDKINTQLYLSQLYVFIVMKSQISWSNPFLAVGIFVSLITEQFEQFILFKIQKAIYPSGNINI